MTEAADKIRDQRRHWAAPGGSHDRRVRLLAKWLPGAVGVVAAAMIVGPLFPKNEISFLLDRTKVAVAGLGRGQLSQDQVQTLQPIEE